MIHFALFETAIGACGVAWSDRGIVGVQLPESTVEITRSRLLRRHPNAHEASPTTHVERAIASIVALLKGEPIDLADVAVDFADVPQFNRRVYEIAREIRPGSTRTYGSIAIQLGDALLAQQVGQALGRNPIPIIVPCHRVLAANGKIGGFSAPGGAETKRRMLLIERALPDEPLGLFDP
jgi:methylated-DNA-[protein]-cysteine S-methyltransferase